MGLRWPRQLLPRRGERADSPGWGLGEGWLDTLFAGAYRTGRTTANSSQKAQNIPFNSRQLVLHLYLRS